MREFVPVLCIINVLMLKKLYRKGTQSVKKIVTLETDFAHGHKIRPPPAGDSHAAEAENGQAEEFAFPHSIYFPTFREAFFCQIRQIRHKMRRVRILTGLLYHRDRDKILTKLVIFWGRGAFQGPSCTGGTMVSGPAQSYWSINRLRASLEISQSESQSQSSLSMSTAMWL